MHVKRLGTMRLYLNAHVNHEDGMRRPSQPHRPSPTVRPSARFRPCRNCRSTSASRCACCCLLITRGAVTPTSDTLPVNCCCCCCCTCTTVSIVAAATAGRPKLRCCCCCCWLGCAPINRSNLCFCCMSANSAASQRLLPVAGTTPAAAASFFAPQSILAFACLSRAETALPAAPAAPCSISTTKGGLRQQAAIEGMMLLMPALGMQLQLHSPLQHQHSRSCYLTACHCCRDGPYSRTSQLLHKFACKRPSNVAATVKSDIFASVVFTLAQQPSLLPSPMSSHNTVLAALVPTGGYLHHLPHNSSTLLRCGCSGCSCRCM
ncbi:hypothetical protein COO60DRAFT_882164 [Scenedesmus sp. NREL 46B-D3]|nr:hypothetical protein COO60DRAFT_882164 [Scenedesmus sp. NREL 46B-D3]